MTEFDTQNADCSCDGDFGGILGCYINPNDPPPPGHKCFCLNFLFGCDGQVVKCGNVTDPGCRGCSEKECCSDDGFLGDCNGY